MDHCKPSLQWLDSDALTMMGPYLSRLSPDDVDSSPKEKVSGLEKKDERQFKVGQVRNRNKNAPPLPPVVF